MVRLFPLPGNESLPGGDPSARAGRPVSKSTDVQIVRASPWVEQIAYRTPIKFGGRVVNDALLLHVEIEVETQGGQRAVGFGSMPLGNVWAWPTSRLAGEQTLAAMRELGEQFAQSAGEYKGRGHPLRLAHDLNAGLSTLAEDVVRHLALSERMPILAQLVAASPVEAALYDAYGRVHDQNVYNLLGRDFVDADLATYLNDDFQGLFLDQFTLRIPKPRMPIYHLVGALDPLTDRDIGQRIDDGLPETLSEWICADGLTHLKIKLAGDDLAWDVSRVAAIDRATAEAQSARGCNRWLYSLDFNERCASVDYVIEFLARLDAETPAALGRVQYIEQPTHRDLRANPENRMHRAAEIKPVVIDESLTDFESLQLSRELGYSGVALKACKGQSEALLMAAAAQHYGMFLCVQDLTCPGASFMHSASLAARIPTIAAIEGNGRQYCPAGNFGWADRYPGMFDISDGTLDTSVLVESGLGYSRPA